MRDLSHKRERFYNVADNYAALYSYTNDKEQLIISSGILNFIWNHWNNFWRDYWIAHVSGGYDFAGNPIVPIYNHYTDKQSCHYLLYASGKKNNHVVGTAITAAYQEATWGDPIIMANIAAKMLPAHAHMNYLLGLIGHYQIYLEHFQRIRNSFTHLNNENVFHLTTIAGYYTFSPHHRVIDILETTEIVSTTRCFDNLVNNMTGLLQNL